MIKGERIDMADKEITIRHFTMWGGCDICCCSCGGVCCEGRRSGCLGGRLSSVCRCRRRNHQAYRTWPDGVDSGEKILYEHIGLNGSAAYVGARSGRHRGDAQIDSTLDVHLKNTGSRVSHGEAHWNPPDQRVPFDKVLAALATFTGSSWGLFFPSMMLASR